MLAKYDAPPHQPKWVLRMQMFLLRHRLMGSFNKQFMIITTTGRRTGQKHSVPIGYIPDGQTYLALNLGGHSHWYLNALTNPCVTLEINGRTIQARAASVPAANPLVLRQVLAVFARERPEMFRNFFGTSGDIPQGEELLAIGKRVAFLRFHPIA